MNHSEIDIKPLTANKKKEQQMRVLRFLNPTYIKEPPYDTTDLLVSLGFSSFTIAIDLLFNLIDINQIRISIRFYP